MTERIPAELAARSRAAQAGARHRPAQGTKILVAGISSTAVLGLTAYMGWSAQRTQADTATATAAAPVTAAVTPPLDQPAVAAAHWPVVEGAGVLDPGMRLAIREAVDRALARADRGGTEPRRVRRSGAVPTAPAATPAVEVQLPVAVQVAVPVPVPAPRAVPAPQPQAQPAPAPAPAPADNGSSGSS